MILKKSWNYDKTKLWYKKSLQFDILSQNRAKKTELWQSLWDKLKLWQVKVEIEIFDMHTRWVEIKPWNYEINSQNLDHWVIITK